MLETRFSQTQSVVMINGEFGLKLAPMGESPAAGPKTCPTKNYVALSALARRRAFDFLQRETLFLDEFPGAQGLTNGGHPLFESQGFMHVSGGYANGLIAAKPGRSDLPVGGIFPRLVRL